MHAGPRTRAPPDVLWVGVPVVRLSPYLCPIGGWSMG